MRNAPIEPYISSYPGTPFGPGSVSNEVRTIQVELNRISDNYPAIPKIMPADGVYGTSTAEAVRVFQGVFGLPQTGIVNKATWYKIKFIFNAVKGLAELSSEGLRPSEVEQLLPQTLKPGSYGTGVETLQYYLNVISYFNPEIPTVRRSSVFDSETEAQVRAFESFYGLTPDGVVDSRTWNLIQRVYNDILANLPENYEAGAAALYPGYFLTEGMDNSDVRLLQQYLNVIGQNIRDIPVVPVTGFFGSQTRNAVEIFQSLYGIPVTGYVGAPTWDAIAREYNYIKFGTPYTG